jgi:hypothetical protein
MDEERDCNRLCAGMQTYLKKIILASCLSGSRNGDVDILYPDTRCR